MVGSPPVPHWTLSVGCMDTYPGISSTRINLLLWNGLMSTDNRKGRSGL